MKHIIRIQVLLLVAIIVTACKQERKSPDNGFDIVGTWVLTRIEHPDGRTDSLNVGKYTRCKIYDTDSTYYSIELVTDGERIMIIPHEMAHYTLNDNIYIENGRVTPFRIINDTILSTFWDGYWEILHKATTITESRKKEICDIVRTYFKPDKKNDRLINFVFSTSERRLLSDNQRLLYIIIILGLVSTMMVLYFFQVQRRKRQLERQLCELDKIRNLRPRPVTDAMKETEADFFKSEYYINLRKKIKSGNNFSLKEWEELEQGLKMVYPDFSTALYQITGLSEVEFRVCLLIKIHATPTEIAGILKREPSTISSIRGRLYHKVFNKNGGAKEWDEFILSL